MKQSDPGLNLRTKRTRKREFLAQMEGVVPWAALVELVTPYAPEGKKGRPPFAVQTMLRIHFMQQWFTLSAPAMEEALHDIALFREFAGLGWDSRLPDESTILRFRHLLEKNQLARLEREGRPHSRQLMMCLSPTCMLSGELGLEAGSASHPETSTGGTRSPVGYRRRTQSNSQFPEHRRHRGKPGICRTSDRSRHAN